MAPGPPIIESLSWQRSYLTIVLAWISARDFTVLRRSPEGLVVLRTWSMVLQTIVARDATNAIAVMRDGVWM